MTKQTVNVGNNANDGSGDAARTAFTKINQNFNEVYEKFTTNPISYLGEVQNMEGVSWNAPSGIYRASIPNVDSRIVLHLNMPGGSTPSLQLAGLYNNGGLFFRTATDDKGFNEPFDKIVTERSGTAPSAKKVESSGDLALITQGGGASGLNLFQIYNNGYPVIYGNLLHFGAYGQNQFACSWGGDNKIFYRSKADISNSWTPWCQLYTTSSTTTDGNGYLKPSSPVVRLYADKIEAINEAIDKGISFEKLGVGDYLIKNTTGLRDDGWYIETPRDSNGNVLVFVEFTQLENKDISVKTFKKKFDIDTASIVADHTKPMDIPTDRWIDLRFNDYPIAEQPTLEATS